MTSSLLPRVLLFTGAAAWLGVSVATLITAESRARLLAWAFPSLLFIGAFAWNARRRKNSLVALACQSIGAIAMVALLSNGYEGLLLVLVAAQLALYGDNRIGTAWILVQSIALAVAIAFHWSLRPALTLGPPYLGFQILMFVAVKLFADERRARDGLDAANRNLLRLQSQLAAKTRAEERLRIAQDMHDVLGHHLTALNLNLELAARQSADTVRSTIGTAQALTRTLLRDIKTLVRSANDEAPVDLLLEMQRLAQELPRPKIHVSCAPDCGVADSRISQALFRVVQEVVTNAIRHGEAGNLWIAIEHSGERVTLIALDDGQAAAATEGFGLTGMRRRLEELGGTLSAAPAPSGGFEVRVELPYTPEASA
jgi:signal transduction histidine kinase